MSHAHLAGGKRAPWKLPAEIAGRTGGLDPNKPFLSDTRAKDAGDGPWTAALLLQPSRADPKDPKAIGVRVSMLGGERTLLVAGRPPGIGERIGTKLVASRKGTETLFVALHEPFRGGLGAHRVEKLRRLAAGPGALAVAVIGRGINDRVLLGYGDDPARSVALAGGDKTFTFSDYAFIRIGADTVEARGSLTALRLKVAGRPRLILNGKKAAAVIKDGVLEFAAK